jgi:hypothetical protein
MPADDPEDRCAVLDGQWSVTEKLQIGRLLDNGDSVQCSPLALSEGDFVDVGLSFDVAFAKAPNGQRKVRVFLCLEHVLQLLPCNRVSEVWRDISIVPILTNSLSTTVFAGQKYSVAFSWRNAKLS